MRIQDMFRSYTANDLDTISDVLRTRNDKGENAFWITRGDDKFPMLSVLIRGELATLQYFRKDRDAGLASVGQKPTTLKENVIAFPISQNSADDLLIQSDSLISVEKAIKAVREFFESGEVPKSVEWLEL